MATETIGTLKDCRVPALQGRATIKVWRIRTGSRWKESNRVIFRRPPSQISGNCLAPYFSDGDIVWHDDRLSPRDGDVVIANMVYLTPAKMLGLPPSRMRRAAIKQYRVVDGDGWLCAAEGGVPASLHEIVGVVVCWQRTSQGFWKRRAQVREMNFHPHI